MWMRGSWPNSNIKRNHTESGRKEVASEEYRDIVQASRGNVRKANVQIKLNLAKEIKDMKSFRKYINDNR